MRTLGLVIILLAVVSGDSPVAVESPDGDVVFSLEDQQIREVERLRKFRPTLGQLALLRAASPSCPNVLDVVTTRFQGCCCESRNKARWIGPRMLRIPIGCLHPWSRDEEDILMMSALVGDSISINELACPTAVPALTDSVALYRHRDDLLADLVMDTGGRLYYEGHQVTDAEITSILSEAQRKLPAGFARDFDLLLPPAFEAFNDLTCINRALAIAVLASKLGFTLRCRG
jgi:hypothetical protein